MVSRRSVVAALGLCLLATALPAQRLDQGAVAPEFALGNITLMLKPSAERQAALEKLLTAQQDSASAEFHHWLTPEEYAERFGASSGDLERIAAWLRGQGFTIRYTARGRDFISFSGTAEQVRNALHTEIHRYRVGAESHFANATDVQLPADIAPLVAGVRGLNDIHPKAPRRKLQALPNYTASDGTNYLLPDDVSTIYDLVPLYSYGYLGASQSIAIVGQSDIDPADIATFRATWGLPRTDIEVISVGNYPGVTGDEVEADLDLEWSGAVARNAKLIYIYGDDAGYAAYYAIDNNVAPVLSESFGLCEYTVASNRMGLSDFQVEAQKGNALGITWLAASGDSGAAGCDYQTNLATQGLGVSLPASVPEITAVGGTGFNEGSGTYWSAANGPTGASALSYIPEMAWNDTVANGGEIGASGGGVSVVYSKPAWQAGTGVPADGMRDVPDLAMAASDAHDPYLMVSEGQAFGVGGTSAATPVFAGMVALLNQFMVVAGLQDKPGLGNINPKLYSMAASGSGNAFHDVTTGDNIVPCQVGTPNCTTGSYGFRAGVGYDQVTGLGSVDAYNFILAYSGIPVSASATSVTASPATITASGSTVITATVKDLNQSITPGGSVSFSLGTVPLGTAKLVGSGASATASITVYGGQLTAANSTIEAYYGGGPAFTPSTGSAVITLGVPAVTSALTAAVTPNPVYQQAADANGATFFFTIQLSETAGVATTVTGLSLNGVSYAGSIANFFGSASLPANGTLSAKMKAASITVPSTVQVVISGRDASGANWTRTIGVPFLPKQ